jgi:hypothetical protein
LALCLLAAPAFAQTRSGLMLIPMPPEEVADLKLEVNQYLQSETDTGFDYDMRLIAARGRILLAPSDKRRSPRLGWDFLHIDTETDDPRIPDDLTEASVAVGFGFPAGGWILGFTAGIGFAGDQAFNGRGAYGLASISGTKRLGERDILQLGLDFDGNRPIFPDVPLPVAIWTRIWSAKLRTSLGFPFLGIQWKPADWFSFSFRGVPGIFQTGDVTFHVHEKWDLFVRYRGANFRFFIDNFSNDNRRLFYTEQRAEFGITWRPTNEMDVIFTVGWAFEREYSVGWDVRDTSTLARLDETALFGLALQFNF